MFFFLFKNFFDQAYKKVRVKRCLMTFANGSIDGSHFLFQREERREEKRLADEKLAEEKTLTNGNANGAKTPLYESMGKLEDSYELRNRVFVGSKN